MHDERLYTLVGLKDEKNSGCCTVQVLASLAMIAGMNKAITTMIVSS